MSAGWTKERIAEMKRLLQGGLSCSAVAAMLGVSRNAIIGKVHRIEQRTGEKWVRRLGAPSGPRKRALDGGRHKHPEPKLAGAPAPAKQQQRPKEPPRRASALPAGITVAGVKPAKLGQPCGILEASGCRWAISSHPKVIGGHVFCNAGTPNGRSYCETHARANVAPYRADTIKGIAPISRGARGYS